MAKKPQREVIKLDIKPKRKAHATILFTNDHFAPRVEKVKVKFKRNPKHRNNDQNS